MKKSKQLERYIKGVANFRRIDILNVVSRNPGITVDGITEKLDWNFKTVSQHTGRLVQAGLLNKNYKGNAVSHFLSPYGKKFLLFLGSF
ncbi:MAG: helix-turn-helix transcriptional regulator [Patescibacteria group bacterium]